MIVNAFEVLPTEFLTWMVKLDAPVEVGVPLMTPAELRERPLGSFPLRLQVSGEELVALRACEYAILRVPSGSEPLRMVGADKVTGAAATVRLNCFELLPAALVARTVKVNVPAEAGVPPIMPVEEPMERPEGSEPLTMLQVSGEDPLAVRVCE